MLGLMIGNGMHAVLFVHWSNEAFCFIKN